MQSQRALAAKRDFLRLFRLNGCAPLATLSEGSNVVSRPTRILDVEANEVTMSADDLHAWVLATEVLFRILARMESDDSKTEPSDQVPFAATHEVAA